MCGQRIDLARRGDDAQIADDLFFERSDNRRQKRGHPIGNEAAHQRLDSFNAEIVGVEVVSAISVYLQIDQAGRNPYALFVRAIFNGDDAAIVAVHADWFATAGVTASKRRRHQKDRNRLVERLGKMLFSGLWDDAV